MEVTSVKVSNAVTLETKDVHMYFHGNDKSLLEQKITMLLERREANLALITELMMLARESGYKDGTFEENLRCMPDGSMQAHTGEW